MSRWTGDPSIVCREVHTTHRESHSTLAGNPTFTATVAVPYSQLADAVSDLLGGPQLWPKPTTILQNVVCVEVKPNNDQGRYTTDSNGETIDYSLFALLDLIYMPRKGRYLIDSNGQDVYWDDEVEPRLESRPYAKDLLIWGDSVDPNLTPQVRIDLHSDEVPSKYEAGETLVHTIEGFDIDYSDLSGLLATVHDALYVSPITGLLYGAEALMLKHFQTIKHYNYKSYQSGNVSTTLKLIYEYKEIGWNKFYRNDVIGGVTGYYFIRQNTSPYNRVDPFPVVSHDKYLGYV